MVVPAIVGGMILANEGSKEAEDAALEGAKANADIEALSRAYQERLFLDEMKRLQPRYETATEQGLPLFLQYADEGRIDQTQMPLYNMQLEAGQNFLQDQGMDNPYSMNRFQEGLGAAENDASYARLQDLLQIGQGATGLAGAGAQNFASGQANSLINTGNVLARGEMTADNIRNSMYQNTLGTLGSIPAYLSQNQQQRPTNLQGPSIPLGGIR